MPGLREDHLNVNGIDTAVLSAGEGEPLVFLHGGGTAPGFEHLLPLAERHRLIVPHHPGFGASADDPAVSSVHDYVWHYLDLLDLLEVDELSLVGHSLGGHIASVFALEQRPRVRRLVLVAPAGLRVREHPTVDLFTVPDDQFLGTLTEDMSVFAGKVPDPPTPEFLAAAYRELTSLARLLWDRPYDLKLPRWLHRLTMPTLLVWGDKDKVVPAGQAPVWADLLPEAEVKIVPGAGHLVLEESREAVDAVGEFVGAGAGVLAGDS